MAKHHHGRPAWFGGAKVGCFLRLKPLSVGGRFLGNNLIVMAVSELLRSPWIDQNGAAIGEIITVPRRQLALRERVMAAICASI
jgi:hypothetical protein